jgi:non-heme chloroperoxidase
MTIESREIEAANGVKLAGYDAGNRNGPEILFIHGFSQCALCWKKQFEDPGLLAAFRLTAFDIRGHGASEKPIGVAHYNDDRLFADDIQSVIAALGLKRPVLVGWSYAGRLIGDYVKAFGTRGLAGINYVGARTKTDPFFNGPGTKFLMDMKNCGVAQNIAATRAFLTSCYALPPPREEFETAFAYNMLVPPEIRGHHLARAPDDGAVLATLDVPVLVTQGSEDQLVLRGLGELTARLVPGAIFSLYEGVGHSPFAEDADRFNWELSDFVRGRSHAT